MFKGDKPDEDGKGSRVNNHKSRLANAARKVRSEESPVSREAERKGKTANA